MFFKPSPTNRSRLFSNETLIFLQTSKDDCTNPCETSGEEFHCDANAYCLLISETSDFKCECKPGYNGTGHECTDVCLGYCDNEGVCFKDSRGQPSCRCSGSFTGKQCTEKSDFFYITGGIASGVILVIFIALLVWMICVRFVVTSKMILLHLLIKKKSHYRYFISGLQRRKNQRRC